MRFPFYYNRHRHLIGLLKKLLIKIYCRKIFLEIVPHTGTYAAWKFTKDIIQKGNVPDERTALDMLANLPMYIPNPNETFTKEMIDFQELKNVTKSVEIAGVLTYSILLHKTYKDIKNTIPAFLSEQLEHYNQNIKSKLIMILFNITIIYISYLKPAMDQSN